MKHNSCLDGAYVSVEVPHITLPALKLVLRIWAPPSVHHAQIAGFALPVDTFMSGSVCTHRINGQLLMTIWACK